MTLALALAACGTNPESSTPVDDSGLVAVVVDDDADGFPADVDCDDDNPAVHPGAAEVCDAIDNDCDALVDDADDSVDRSDQPVRFLDADGDGFGAGDGATFCTPPSNYVADGSDCDDARDDVFPGALEICNETDDDCDALIDDADDDVDLSLGTTFYVDADGDTFGDAAGTVLACAAPVGFVEEPTDCDDTRSQVHPEASELCDDLDTDCDETTGEAGLASFTDRSGVVTGLDFTDPGWASKEGGVLAFCEGQFDVHLTVSHDVEIVGIPADRDLVALHGQDKGPVLTVDDAATTVNGLRMVHGSGTDGGGFSCVGPNGSLTLTNVLLEDHESTRGAAGFSDGCDLVLDDVVIQDNEASEDGGGLSVANGDVDATDVLLYRNVAGARGGGFFLQGGTFDFDGVVVATSVAPQGGGVFLENGDLAWARSASMSAQAVNNRSDEGALYFVNATLDAIDLDVDNIEMPDLLIEDNGFAYAGGEGLTMTCDPEGCGTPVLYDVSIASTPTNGGDQGYVLNFYWTDGDATLERFEHYVDADADCTYSLVALSKPLRGSWTEHFRRDVTKGVDFVGLLSSGDIGILVEPWRYYALGIEWDCPTGTMGLRMDDSEAHLDGGIGEGWAFAWGFDTAIDLSTLYESYSYEAPFEQRLHVVDLD